MPSQFKQLDPPQRVLLGPGPSDVPARVLQALAAPTVGHLDPSYLAIMDETRQMLRGVFQTKNELTLAVSGTGSAGMEACVVNLIEPGNVLLLAALESILSDEDAAITRGAALQAASGVASKEGN
ncbi:MAG: aminotransferase class V-fold PLP-dependent enzyme [Planctomycetes bacterium]|nr:aminotransferase class V-fold PLP-dependent enzyme [Planctomycetota bacterium]